MLAVLAAVVVASVGCGPDVKGAKREVERTLPDEFEVLSVEEYDCGRISPGGCTIEYRLAEDGDRHAENAAMLKQNLLTNGWTEVSFGSNERSAGGSFEKRGLHLYFALKSTSTLEQCAETHRDGIGCYSNLGVRP